MRDIQFRAWDVDKKRYWESAGFCDSDCGRTVIQEALMVGGGERLSTWDGQKTRMILEQYVGVKDKNGRKIFEGDLVKATIEQILDDVKVTGVVEIEDGNATLVIDKYGCSVLLSILEEFEVIGNIHQNPELLKP